MMGKGNKSTNNLIEGGIEGGSSDCDVGLGLKMQNSESFPSLLPYHHSSSISNTFNAGYGGRSSGPSSFVTYDAVSSPATLLHSVSPFKSSSSGRNLFTASQWQDFERQTLIYKYMMASVPVPPQLLKTLPLSQSNSGGLDLRFSGASDPEPWRCRRTDGKKWRCSRDVAPEQKYCERHAHKTRSRSRKHVENQTQISKTTTTTTTINKGNSNCTNRPPPLPVFAVDPFQNHVSQFQTPSSASSFDQARCIEWFMKGGNTTPDQQQSHHNHQSSSSSSRSIGYKRDITDHMKTQNPPFFHQYEELNFISPYMSGQDSPRYESHQLTNCLDDTNTTTHTTRHFIDAWSTEREDVNSSAPKLPLSSLTLSMSGSDGTHEDNDEAEKVFLKSHWLNPAMWMGSPPPGGPLGEALCLGPATGPNVLFNNSNSNSTSSCSKNSCEDGGQGHNFSR